MLTPSGQGARRSERVGNASVALLVRHRPGRARVSPSRPVVSEGGAVTLSCAATPPGWPAPQYRLVINKKMSIIVYKTDVNLTERKRK